MKRIVLSAVALALAAGTAASAQPYRDDHREIRQDRRDIRDDRQELRQDRRDAGFHRYGRGERLDGRYGAYSEVGDWRAHRLSAPRRGYHWVRHGNDYVLAAIGTGLIASVIANSNY